MATGYEDLDKLTEQQNSLLQQQEQKQNEIINQQTQMQIDQLNRDKEKLDQETQKTTSGLYTDYQKQVNQYGAGMEQLQEQGLANSGYAETTRTALYNNYQKSVTDTLNKSNQLKADYDFQMQQARQNGNIQQAQSALELYSQKLQLLTQNYQYRYQIQRDEISDSQWQKQFDYQVKQNELENEWRQKQFDYQKQRDEIADSQWKQQFELSKKKSASSSSNRTQYSVSGKDVSSTSSNKNVSSNEMVQKLYDGISGMIEGNNNNINQNVARQLIYNEYKKGTISEEESTMLFDKLGL